MVAKTLHHRGLRALDVDLGDPRSGAKLGHDRVTPAHPHLGGPFLADPEDIARAQRAAVFVGLIEVYGAVPVLPSLR